MHQPQKPLKHRALIGVTTAGSPGTPALTRASSRYYKSLNLTPSCSHTGGFSNCFNTFTTTRGIVVPIRGDACARSLLHHMMIPVDNRYAVLHKRVLLEAGSDLGDIDIFTINLVNDCIVLVRPAPVLAVPRLSCGRKRLLLTILRLPRL